MTVFRILAAWAAIWLFAATAAAEEREGVYFIYDSSNSMWGVLPDETRKYEAARVAMRELAKQDFGDRDVALRMYGHRRKDDCTDSELVVPWGSAQSVAQEIADAMQSVRPTGRTPIDRSLRQALQDFGDRRGTIILVSDGIESCDADPCALVREWRERDVAITVHVVGLGLRGKERQAMACIAEAAGTQYRDAFSLDELVAGLGSAVSASNASEKPETGEPQPKPQTTEPRVRLDITTPDGQARRGQAVFTPKAGGDPIIVDSDGRFPVPEGEYTVEGGVLTIGGTVYKPVRKSVAVGFDGADMTVLLENVPRPPEAGASFAMDGQAVRETVVLVFRDGKKIGGFHGDQTAFVPEGELEFRATPSGTSQEISVTETFGPGDIKTIHFEAETEVKLLVNLHLGNTGEKLLSKPALEMFQNGERITKLNRSSGGLIRPGTYILKADDGVNSHEQELVVTSERNQVVDISLPAGTLTVEYQDVAGQIEKPKRVFVYPESGIGGVTRQSDKPIALLPGTYIIEGHPKRAEYPRTVVSVSNGKNTAVLLRAGK